MDNLFNTWDDVKSSYPSLDHSLIVALNSHFVKYHFSVYHPNIAHGNFVESGKAGCKYLLNSLNTAGVLKYINKCHYDFWIIAVTLGLCLNGKMPNVRPKEITLINVVSTFLGFLMSNCFPNNTEDNYQEVLNDFSTNLDTIDYLKQCKTEYCISFKGFDYLHTLH